MNKEDLEVFDRKAAKTLKTEQDLNEFRAMLTKVTVEAALNADWMITSVTPSMSNHLQRIAVMALFAKCYALK